jgi:hypothetical protein
VCGKKWRQLKAKERKYTCNNVKPKVA